MELHKVSPLPAFICTCCFCGSSLQSDRVPIYADLQGKPFADYYCEYCAALLYTAPSLAQFEAEANSAPAEPTGTEECVSDCFDNERHSPLCVHASEPCGTSHDAAVLRDVLEGI